MIILSGRYFCIRYFNLFSCYLVTYFLITCLLITLFKKTLKKFKMATNVTYHYDENDTANNLFVYAV